MRRVLAIFVMVGFASMSLAKEVAPTALDRLPPADVVILGEVHDNPLHHQNQARAVAAIKPAALVFEMLTREQAARVNANNRRSMATLEKALGWNGTGWPDFSQYYPIFAAAPNARIFGAALPRAEVRRAVSKGATTVFGAVFGVDATKFGLDQKLATPEQSAREAGQMEAHCNALPTSLLGGMVEAQRLRDASLARAVLTARKLTGGPVVVITGNGHARNDWGVPALLKKAVPGLSVLSLGQMESAPEQPAPYDLYLVTKPAERPDPCAVFRKG